jgi:hypothetical protein
MLLWRCVQYHMQFVFRLKLGGYIFVRYKMCC